MSMFEVWLLLVFIPNLGPLVFIIAIMATFVSMVAGFIVVDAHESLKDPRIIKLWKDKEIWSEKDECDEQKKIRVISRGKKIIKICLSSAFIASLVIIGVPSKKEMMAIVAVPYISNNPEFKKLPENVGKVLNNLIKEYGDEMAPEKER